jgi:hypothetical protein
MSEARYAAHDGRTEEDSTDDFSYDARLAEEGKRIVEETAEASIYC